MKRRRHDRHQEPKLSQEDWDAILDSAIAASSRVRRPRQRELNPILKAYLLQHKVLVQYLHDLYGFRRGVLVATGKDRIGWSSVSDYDVEIRRIDPLKLPTIQGLMKKGASLAEIMSNKAYEKQSKKTALSLFRSFDSQYWNLLSNWPSRTRYGSNHAQEAS